MKKISLLNEKRSHLNIYEALYQIAPNSFANINMDHEKINAPTMCKSFLNKYGMILQMK